MANYFYDLTFQVGGTQGTEEVSGPHPALVQQELRLTEKSAHLGASEGELQCVMSPTWH